MTQNFINLKYLYVNQCKEMEQLVIRVEKKRNNLSIEIEEDDQNKKQNDKDDGKMTPITFPKLERLFLGSLSSLTSIGKEIENIEFPMLNESNIWSCSKFKGCDCSSMDDNTSWEADKPHNNRSLHLFCNPKVKFGGLTRLTINDVGNFTSLFSSSMTQNFVNLKYLHVNQCKEMEQLVIRVEKKRNNISIEIEEDEQNKKQNDKDDGKMTTITFSKLETLCLWSLSSLTSIGKEIENIEFPMLNHLDIMSCPKFKDCDCPFMDNNTNWEADKPYNIRSLHLFCNPKVKFGGLTRLYINDVGNFTSLFSSSIVQNLVNLNFLGIITCKEMEQLVIGVEKKRNNISIKIEEDDQSKKQNDKDNGNMTPITFPKLEMLQLVELSSLTSIGKEIGSIEFPMLNELIIRSCPKFKSCDCSSMDNNTSWKADKPHDNRSLHFFCIPKVKFNELKVLRICEYEDVSNMWCQHISLYFFRTLEKVEIQYCNSIGILFSSPIAESLVNLKVLELSYCELMEKVIAGEKEIQEHSILFPNLERLELNKLPLLEMLCEWKYTLECPLLERIIIKSCARMKFLTHESLNTPKLSYMKVDGQEYRNEDFNGMKDLNCFLRQNIRTPRKQESSSTVTMDQGEIK